MKTLLTGLVIILLLLSFGCTNSQSQKDLEKEKAEVLEKFDGYEWSWWCFDEENKYILYKTQIYSAEKSDKYWIIKGNSGDGIIIVYDKESDKITDWQHGENVGTAQGVNEKGKLMYEGFSELLYC